ncbi:PREDICTED: uncharacterized protein LOC104599143 [Nelumbo nucifera]|uniref:Uncharacterized protein LOC104599143 n=1 Tax=Nelumbo nucifera TaxID=4432 RepID=A0A1U8ADK3_NELNU|nr:PREDICTED: uncharacterized protein LOC104599143 [Nelumbo nucifera]
MMVANSFDLWQKDAFFSAAEEVQESADTMESVYRKWLRERREGVGSEDLNELRRELQTALGTAKWQLEEFERAVRLSDGNHSEDNTTTRHRQFVEAMEDQISRVENALRESLDEEGKQPLRWVNLDEEERDDLAAFLVGTPGTSQSTKELHIDLKPSTTNSSFQGNKLIRKSSNFDIEAGSKIDMPNDVKGFKEETDAKHVVELEDKEFPRERDDLHRQAERFNNHRRIWSSPNFGYWKIAIADDDEQRKTPRENVESPTKGKEFKYVIRKQRGSEQLEAKGRVLSYTDLRGINWVNQGGWIGEFQRRLQGTQQQLSCSLQFTLVLMLTIFLIVPFLLYAT